MRSAEISGVTAEDDVVSKAGKGEAGRPAAAIVRLFARGRTQLSPVALAIAVTGFAAAALFVAYDMLLDLTEAHLATTSLRSIDIWNLWAGIGERAGVVFAMACCVAIFGLYRFGGMNVSLRNHKLDVVDLLETIPFGVALWTANGKLLACNAHYVARLHREGPPLLPGRSYADAVKRLTRGGYTRLVRQDDRRRILELYRDDGSCLMMDERPLTDGGFVTLLSDVTERRRESAALARQTAFVELLRATATDANESDSSPDALHATGDEHAGRHGESVGAVGPVAARPRIETRPPAG